MEQYNNYSPAPGVKLNGQLTLGENIGDLGGVLLDHSAYQKYAASHYPEGNAPILNGFTGNQRFFMGYAQVWRSITTAERARELASTNPHIARENSEPMASCVILILGMKLLESLKPINCFCPKSKESVFGRAFR